MKTSTAIPNDRSDAIVTAPAAASERASRKGCRVRRWTAEEDLILMILVKDGFSDAQIYETGRLEREIYMIGYRRRIICPEYVDTERRKNALKAVRIGEYEEAVLLAALRQWYKQRPDWFFQWRYCVSAVRVVRLRLSNALQRDGETTGHVSTALRRSANRQQAVRDLNDKVRAELRSALTVSAASENGERRQCTVCSTQWPASGRYFFVKEDKRKKKSYLTHRCRCCPPVSRPERITTGSHIQLLQPWIKLFGALETAYPQLVSADRGMRLVDYKTFVASFTGQRPISLYSMARAVLAAALECGINLSLIEFEARYFGGEKALSETLDFIGEGLENEPVWRNRDQPFETGLTLGCKSNELVKALYALLSFPGFVSEHMI